MGKALVIHDFKPRSVVACPCKANMPLIIITRRGVPKGYRWLTITGLAHKD